jgi:hypothetical protein
MVLVYHIRIENDSAQRFQLGRATGGSPTGAAT